MAYVVLLTISLGIFLRYLPNVLNGLGLHPDYKGVSYVLPGARVLIVTTSQSTLGSSGKATGVFASEMTAPYYVFVDAGSHVDIASVKGGGVPIEPDSLKWFLSTPSDKRYLKDRSFQSKVTSSLKIDDVDFKQYDIIFLAGGWGVLVLLVVVLFRVVVCTFFFYFLLVFFFLSWFLLLFVVCGPSLILVAVGLCRRSHSRMLVRSCS